MRKFSVGLFAIAGVLGWVSALIEQATIRTQQRTIGELNTQVANERGVIENQTDPPARLVYDWTAPLEKWDHENPPSPVFIDDHQGKHEYCPVSWRVIHTWRIGNEPSHIVSRCAPKVQTH